MDSNETLLRAILAMTARQAFSPERLVEIVCKGGGGKKQIAAYNMCDGTASQGDIAKRLKLDSGNFSRTAARWIREGVVIRIGEGRDSKLLHAYPIL